MCSDNAVLGAEAYVSLYKLPLSHLRSTHHILNSVRMGGSCLHDGTVQ
jgi:hypothetical protein